MQKSEVDKACKKIGEKSVFAPVGQRLDKHLAERIGNHRNAIQPLLRPETFFGVEFHRLIFYLQHSLPLPCVSSLP